MDAGSLPAVLHVCRKVRNMHVVYDENGNPVSHGHTHCEHQEHCHHHDHAEGQVKLSALLEYMLNHNQHHAKELDDLSAKLAGQGKNEAAGYIRTAVDEFQKGNMYLSLALSALKESD